MKKSNEKCNCEGSCGDNCKCVTKTLADLVPGESAVISSFSTVEHKWQKFYNIGLIHGSKILLESFAPFGGSIRVKVMNSSIVLHKDAAANILVKQ